MISSHSSGKIALLNNASSSSSWKSLSVMFIVMALLCIFQVRVNAAGQCSVCAGNWDGPTCSLCKSGWTGMECNVPICSINCATCSAPNVCPTCKPGWYGSDCSSDTPIPILNSTQITKFKNLIIPNAQLTSSKLLFKATRDGFSASAFHSKCDNKGPTIVIVKAASGAIFGGFTSQKWFSGIAWVEDNFAFLFSLVSSTKEERFTKLTYQNSSLYKNGALNNTNAIFAYTWYGPAFGRGNDFMISEFSNTNTDSYSALCLSYCDTTMTSDTKIANSYLAGSRNFQVADYEVYSL